LKKLVIIYHSKTGNTKAMVDAVLQGARNPQINGVESRLTPAAEAQPEDLLEADGLIVATPENFGYMSGALKDFFDRSFYEVEGQVTAPALCHCHQRGQRRQRCTALYSAHCQRLPVDTSTTNPDRSRLS
jgi:multimeric flavodoxin WrbA